MEDRGVDPHRSLGSLRRICDPPPEEDTPQGRESRGVVGQLADPGGVAGGNLGEHAQGGEGVGGGGEGAEEGVGVDEVLLLGGDGCYAEEYRNPFFNVSCNYSADPPRPFIRDANILAISLGGQGRIEGLVAYDCYDREGNLAKFQGIGLSLGSSGFRYRQHDNIGLINGTDSVKYAGGCISTCRSPESIGEMGWNCSGVGCCETAIPCGLFTFDATISSFSRHRSCWEFNPCGYAFLVEKSNFAFDVSDILSAQSCGWDVLYFSDEPKRE